MSLLGHLEMVEVFKKAFRRSGLPLAKSQGFHPQPRLAFLTAQPLGQESFQEILVATFYEPRSTETIRASLLLPEGLVVKRAQFLPPGSPKPKVTSISYQIESDTDLFGGQPLHPAALLRYTDTKGRAREYPLATFVLALAAQTPRSLVLTLRQDPAGSPKPLAAARALYGLSDDEPLRARKLATNLA
jgi:radical SAM-linked protein